VKTFGHFGTFHRAALAMVLPEGIESDRQVDTLRLAVKNLQDLGDKVKDKLQAPRAKSFIQDIVRSLDPETNPSGYRICQDEIARLGGAKILIETVAQVASDLVRSLALEALARMMFGNPAVAELVLQSCELLPMLRMVFSNGSLPEKLTALQLAQVVAASEVLDASRAQALLQEAEAFLQGMGFVPISQAALEVFVSISFTHPAEVISCLGCERIQKLLSEQEDRLQAFVCSLLASNCLSLLEESQAHDLRSRLQSSTFLQDYVECLQASLQKCDWPENSNAFHSPRRLALVAHALTEQGLGRDLLPAVPFLVQAVECFSDAVPTLLVTLKLLAADPRCLQLLLAEESFRQHLDLMHQAGDTPYASELLGYMELVENAMAVGQAAKLAQAQENPNAPEVMQLAELFSGIQPLDGKLEAKDLLELCARVPLAPRDRVLGSLHCDLTLQAFLEHVYGTPTILGWWPSLMEEAAGEAARSGLPLVSLCGAFELAAKRGHVEIQDLHEVVLPTLGLPTDGAAVEEKFAELHGSAPLPFRALAKWLADLNIKLSESPSEETP